jgi:cytochrome bd-type quinol oxidase subunit 2
MLIVVIPVILVSSIGTTKFLSFISIPSIMISITGMLCIIYYIFDQITSGARSKQESELKIIDFWKMLGRIGLAMCTFDGSAIVINI